MTALDSLLDSEIVYSSVGGLYFGATAVFIYWCILVFILITTVDKAISIISFSLYCSLLNPKLHINNHFRIVLIYDIMNQNLFKICR